MLTTIVVDELFAFLLAFTRIGAALMVLPGFSAASVSTRIRLLLSLLITAVVLPTIADVLPAPPESSLALAALLAGEVVIGLFIGYIARLLLTALEVAGTIIAFSSSLANASIFNPAAAEQSTIVSTFLLLTAMLLIFVTDLHHLMLMAVVGSYDVFQPGAGLPVGDMAEVMARLVARSFVLGVELAAPLIVVAIVFQFAMGLIARLMPQLMIFFIAIPVQITLGLVVLSIALSAMMLFWLRTFQDGLIDFLGF